MIMPGDIRRFLPLLACLALGGSAGTGCWPVDRLEGKACDVGHPCVVPYSCVEGLCIVVDSGAPIAPGPLPDAGDADREAPDGG